jgi:hypothetical protein
MGAHALRSQAAHPLEPGRAMATTWREEGRTMASCSRGFEGDALSPTMRSVGAVEPMVAMLLAHLNTTPFRGRGFYRWPASESRTAAGRPTAAQGTLRRVFHLAGGASFPLSW